MIKKKSSILLLLSLAVLFIGSFSITYASSYTLTEQNIYDIWDANKFGGNNNDVNNGYGRAKRMIGEAYAQFDSVAISIYGRSVPYSCDIYGWNKSDVASVSNYHDLNYMQIGLNGNVGKSWNVYSNQTQTINSIALGTGAQLSTKYYFYSNDLILPNYTGPYETEDIVFAEKFIFSPTSTNFQICSIQGLTTPSQVYVYDRTSRDGNILTIGYLEQFSFLESIAILRYRYSKTNGWVETSAWATDNFDGYNIQNDILTYTIDTDKIPSDTLVLFSFQPNDEQFTNQDFWLYIKSSNTVITNGVIIPDDTFTDNYYDNYNNDTNTDKIIDNNDENSEGIKDFLKDTYDKMFTVSGEEINSIVNNAISKINIESGELVETTIILDYLNRQPGDFVISWNDMTTHFSIQNQQLENQITIPTRQINFSELERNSTDLQEVMRWERIIVNIGIFSIILHEIYILFLKTIGVSIDIYGQKQEEKATLKAAQEREKATTRRQIFNANQDRLREYEKMARKKGWKK